jgi:hypothetical protein
VTPPKRLRILLTLLILAGALYCYWPLDFPLGPCQLGYESLALACSLAHKASFSDPFFPLSTGPSAHVAPLLPMLFSVLVRWFGDGPAAMNAVQWVGTLTFAVQVSLWPWIAGELGMGFASGVIGAAAWLGVRFVSLPMWEAAEVAILLPVLSVCMYRILTRPVTTRFVSLTAAFWGITFLLNPVPLLWYAVVTVWIVVCRPIPRIHKLAVIFLPFAVISPWLVRNYRVFHHAVLVRDNLGMEMAISNNDCATFWSRNNLASNCYQRPNESAVEAAEVRTMGEYEYNREKMREAFLWIRRNPGKFAELTKQRFLAFWFSIPNGDYLAIRRVPASMIVLWLTVPLSIAGLWMLSRRDSTAAQICVAWLVLYPIIYYFIQYTSRYHYPIYWATFLPASYVLKEGAVRVWARARKSAPPLAPAPHSQ